MGGAGIWRVPGGRVDGGVKPGPAYVLHSLRLVLEAETNEQDAEPCRNAYASAVCAQHSSHCTRWKNEIERNKKRHREDRVREEEGYDVGTLS